MKAISSMTLGTVQLGMNYGIANNAGKPDEEKAHAILQAALEGSVTSLDTARGYGNSEEVIGRFLKQWKGKLPFITTKIPRLQGESEKELEKFATESLETSMTNLGVSKVNAVMLHAAGDLQRHGTAAEKAMNALLRHGYTDQIGVSVYNADEIEEMLKYESYSVTQAPISIFDQRIIACGAADKLKDRGYTVFVRSVFLQGLFFLDPEKLDDPILLEYAADKIRLLHRIAEESNMSVAQLAISFMRDCAGVTSLVLGADTPEQVRSNISYFSAPALDPEVTALLRREFSDVNIPMIMQVLSRPKK